MERMKVFWCLKRGWWMNEFIVSNEREKQKQKQKTD